MECQANVIRYGLGYKARSVAHGMGDGMAVVARKNDLARVINDRIAALGEKNLQIIADRCDPPVPMPYLSKVANGLIKRPDQERLRGIAFGLGVPVEELQAAILRPPRPVSEREMEFPPDFLSAFYRVQTHLTQADLDDLYESVVTLANLVDRAHAERELGPTNYSDETDDDRA